MSDDVSLTFDRDVAVDRLMRLLSVQGITGEEKEIGAEIVRTLAEGGVPPKYIRFDKANERIPVPTQTGNLIVTLPGTRPGTRRLFMTHMDTVPLCAGAEPVRKGKRIVPKGKTALGGDNRTGVACLVNVLATLMKNKLPHPPLTFLFTVREESGLWGARHVDPQDLGMPEMGFNVDGRSPREITVGAVGAERWEAEIRGQAAHAGVHPERGISAIAVASIAIADVHRGGWFGKVKKDGKVGTSNIGVFGGSPTTSAGQATNVVTDFVFLKGECRSHDKSFVRQITQAYRDALKKACTRVKDDRGRPAKVVFNAQRDYYPFRLQDNSPVVQLAQQAGQTLGWDPVLRTTDGGLDANWMVRHGIPTITFGAGQHEIHTVNEYVEVSEFLEGCQYALMLATQ